MLLNLLSEKVTIIEDKKSDASATKKKNKAWDEICTSFCSASIGCRRDLKEIRDQWKRMKAAAKNDFSRFVKEKKRTGGGPEPKAPNDLTMKIKDLLPKEFQQMSNPYDDDVSDSGTQEDEDYTEMTPLDTSFSASSSISQAPSSSVLIGDRSASIPSTPSTTTLEHVSPSTSEAPCKRFPCLIFTAKISRC